MGMPLSVIIVECFLQELTNKKRLTENCSGVPDNFKWSIPMAMYFDFETTASTNNCFDPEQKKKCLSCLMF